MDAPPPPPYTEQGRRMPRVAARMDLELDGKVAIVGGASKGLGKATALALAREGARLCLYARGKDALDATAEEIRKATGTDVVTVQADAAKADDLERVVATTVRELGGVDILVANQGGPAYNTPLTATDAEWQSGWELAHMSVVRLTRLVVPEMRKRGGGRIIAITMTGVYEHTPELAVSTATRLAITGFTKDLAREVGKDGILVNNVLPGWIHTDRLEYYVQERARAEGRTVAEVEADLTEGTPRGRFGKPEEVADMITFLASARASFVTGGNFVVDGGTTVSVSA